MCGCRVCLDQNVVVSFDPLYNPENPDHLPLPDFHVSDLTVHSHHSLAHPHSQRAFPICVLVLVKGGSESVKEEPLITMTHSVCDPVCSTIFRVR